MPRTINPELNEERRRQILRAAANCFAARGFHQTTMKEITSASGMSAGGLYRYFKTKDDLVVGIAEAEGLENEALIEVLEETADPLSALATITPWILQAFADSNYGRLAVEVLSEASRNPRVAKVLARNENQLKEAVEKALARGQKRGMVDASLSAAHLAELVLSTFSGLAARGILDGAYRPEELTSCVLTLFRKFLRPRNAT